MESVSLMLRTSISMTRTFRSIVLGQIGMLVVAAALTAQPASAPVAHEILLQLDVARSGADITLAGNLHTVKGTFLLKRGAIQFDPATGKASGEIAFDATSGKTGNSSRDNKMHKDVIESWRYPEIVFHPARAEGTRAAEGTSMFRVHGLFTMHGAEHEVTFPVEVTFAGNAWTAKASIQVPYVQWGMKNPSVLFLKVSDTVQVQFHAAGSLAP